jgi:hypothetical protein
MGAHVSIVYPEEAKKEEIRNDLALGKLDLLHHFEIHKFASIKLNKKTYFALSIHSETLTNLRIRYSLLPLLNFRRTLVPFHITLAVQI